MIDYKQAYEWLFEAVDEIINKQFDNLNLLAMNINGATSTNGFILACDTIQGIINVLEESETRLEAAENEANNG